MNYSKMSFISLKTLLLPAALLSFYSVSAAPFVTIDFRNEEEGVIESSQRNVTLRLDGDVRIQQNGPTGKPFVEFPGTPDCGVRLDARKATPSFSGQEAAVSFWFRPDALADTPIAFGFSLKKTWRWSEAPVGFSLATKKNDFGSYNIWARFQGNPPTNGWHHLAFLYSMSNNVVSIWYDGIPQKDSKIEADEPSPIENLFGAPFAKGFPGAISDIRIWNSPAAPAEILEMDVSAEAKKQMAAPFAEAAADQSLTKSFRDWCKSVAERIGAFSGKCNVRDWQRYAKLRSELPQMRAFAAAIASGNARGLDEAPFIPLSIYPFHWLKRLPFRIPEDGQASGEVRINAAIGEYEPASFMAYSLATTKEFHIKATDLVADGGATLNSSAVDIRTVKVWHAPASGWNSYFGGGREFPVLTPEILLHDDAVIKVDKDAHKNYLRLSYPSGDRYVDISKTGTPESLEPFLTDVEPVRDAKDFRPMPLTEGELSQFWITVKVPDDAKPGLYKGTLQFTAEGAPAGSMPLVLNVHPFKLPRPATRYNIDAEFTGTWYNHINLNVKMGRPGVYWQGGAGSLSNACRRLRGELRNLAEHGQYRHFGIAYNDPAEYDLSDIQLDIMKETGMDTSVIHSDFPAIDPFWCAGMSREPEKYNYDTSIEAHPDLYRERMAFFTSEVIRVKNKIQQKLGHSNFICYGIDEAGVETVRREMPFFATLQHFGGKAFISMSIAQWTSFMTDYNNIPAYIGRTVARNWHEGGARVGTYAAPFTGPENPELWRRSMGIRVYMANYDAVYNYNWYEGANVWNGFINSGRYGNFCIVYPTADGVVDTVAWEAQREGFDDLRYLTLVRRLARQAMRSGKTDLVRLGRRAYAWAELVDPESVDLDRMRLDAAEKIIELQNALGDTDISALYK